MTEGFWELIALRLDSSTRRSDRGRSLLGGSPLRLLRLSDRGARMVDDLLTGEAVGPDRMHQQLARRLLDAGLAHPVPLSEPDVSLAVVVPVRDGVEDLRALLVALGAEDRALEIVVVDDGSVDPTALEEAAAGRARVLHHGRARGPAAARNTGWRATTAEVVVFVDADVLPTPGWLHTVLSHFVDPAVAAVAPRIEARRASASALDRYEEHRSPLDLGPEPARVAPGSRVSYVPTATIAYRRAALEEADGFDERLRVGEDVDLVWRTGAVGHTIRYEPAAVVSHRNRASWPGLVRQRMTYGSSAAPLDLRHPGAVAPVEANAWSLAAWALPAIGGWRGGVAGVATAAVTTAALVPKLRDRLDDPVAEALRLGGLGHVWAGRWLASAVTRAWLPAALAGAAFSPRIRRAAVLAAVVPAVLDWYEIHPDLDLFRWVAAHVVDDASYCAGVWWGCWQQGSWRSLAPRMSGIPGITDRTT